MFLGGDRADIMVGINILNKPILWNNELSSEVSSNNGIYPETHFKNVRVKSHTQKVQTTRVCSDSRTKIKK